MRRWSVIVAVWGLVRATAWAQAPTSAEMDELSVRLEEVAQLGKSYEQVAGPSGGALTETEAVDRFKAAVYLHLLGEHEAASEAFFVLLSSRSLDGVGLTRDAEWYLAESLLATGNEDIAIARYLTIARTTGHPLREDAVRRLLEIYANDTDSSRFERLYEEEVITGGVAVNDLIMYAIAKTWWRNEDTARAKDYLQRITAESPYFSRARYLAGAMLVQAGDASSYEQAAEVFAGLMDVPGDQDADKAVRDLSRLALARIELERGQLDAALAAYLGVADDSQYLPEKLHELTWVHIGRKDYASARESADRFLKIFPDHSYTAELNLIRGHLLFEVGAYDDALVSYDKVVADYTPVRQRFLRLAVSEDRAEAYVHQVMELERGGGVEEGEVALPGYAVSMMLTDGKLARAVALFRELERQDSSIAAAEVLSQQIAVALGSGADSTGSVQGLRFSASEARLKALRVGVALLSAEERWLRAQPEAKPELLAAITARIGDVSRRVDTIGVDIEALRYGLGSARAGLRAAARDRDELVARVVAVEDVLAKVRDSGDAELIASATASLEEAKAALASLGATEDDARVELDSAAGRLVGMTEPVERDIRALASDLVAARRPMGADVDMDPLAARLDRLHATLGQTLQSLQRVDLSLQSGEGGQLVRIRDVWKRETAALRAERGELKARYADAERVAGGLVRQNFVRLADEFGQSILGADMGAVNVYWSSLLVMGEKIDAVASERNRTLRELERHYGWLQKKVGP